MIINEGIPGHNANIPRDDEGLNETITVTETLVQGVAPFVSPEIQLVGSLHREVLTISLATPRVCKVTLPQQKVPAIWRGEG